ncbi:MAG TPA: hypothetical protein VIX59_19865 [Candidatus Binataceae bacterium]
MRLAIRPCSTAVLVLAGWFLMLPPERTDYAHRYDADAPLAQWSKYPVQNPTVYDTQAGCENDIKAQSATVLQLNASLAKMFEAARCVSTDDPALPQARFN